MLGFYAPYVFIGKRAEHNGATADQATALLSAIGITNTIGRVAYGWLADRQWITSQTIVNVSLLAVAVVNCAFAFTSAYEAAVAYALTFGFVVGTALTHVQFALASLLSLTSVVLVEQVGIDKLTNAYGLLCVCRGVAIVFGSPLAGLFYDMTGSFDASFLLSAVLFLLASATGALASCPDDTMHAMHGVCNRFTHRHTHKQQRQQHQSTPDMARPTEDHLVAHFVPLPPVQEEDEMKRTISVA